MTTSRTTLARSDFLNALTKFGPGLTPAIREATEKLANVMADDGRIAVAKARAALFPLAEAKSASAQLSKLLKAIEAAATKAGFDITAAYQGEKAKGVAGRTVAFLSASASVAIDIVNDLSATQNEPQAVEPRALVLSAPDVVLMTFNDHEEQQVREAFWAGKDALPPRVKDIALPLVDLGIHGGLRVVHYHGGQGSRHSARDATELSLQLAPRFVIAVGIAFGMDDTKQKIGDVLVSDYVVDYERAKVHRDGVVTLRGGSPNASRRLREELTFLNNRMKAHADWPVLRFGGVLTGDKLIDNLQTREELRRLVGHDDIVGGEMEAAGLATAFDGRHIDWIVVKGICDFADGNKGKDKEARQRHAARNAAVVVKALLGSGGLASSRPSSGNQPGVPRKRKARPSDRSITPAVSDMAFGSTIRPATITCGEPTFAYEFYADKTLAEDASPPNIASPTTLATARTLRDPTKPDQQEAPADEARGVEVVPDILRWLQSPSGPPLYAVLGEYGMGKTFSCQRLAARIDQRRRAGEALPHPVYLDLRKVTNATAPNERENKRGHVPTLQEVLADCLRHGVLTGSGRTPTPDDVWAAVNAGAVVIFDGLDEVLNLLNEHQGQTFTANLLRMHTEGQQRARVLGANSRAATLRLVVSCRTQFFRSLLEQNQHLTGEWRGAHDAEAFRAVLMLPFRDEQIRRYLATAFPGQDTDALVATIESVHNLREMAGRPFTLKLIARFLPRIEQWRAQGRKVSGVTLYREVAQDWLMRDKNKQHFRIEDKLALATDLAAHLWREGERGVSASELETWLGGWLKTQHPDAEFQGKPRELLQEDLRNATFLKRVDSEDAQQSRFHFAHTSLQEFLLANHLFHALDAEPDVGAAALRDAWAMRMVSRETLDFFGQMLEESDDTPDRLRRLGRLRETYMPQASELLMRYGQLAYERDLPMPSLVGIDLRGAMLEEWHFGNRAEPPYVSPPTKPKLDLSGARFDGARLRRSRFWHVRLEGASFEGSLAAQAEWLECSVARVNWQGAELVGVIHRENRDAHEAPPTLDATLMLGRGHQSFVSACAFSPDGTRVVSASWDQSLRLWDAHSGECLRVLQGHTDPVTGCAFSPDGTRVVSASWDQSLRLWDAHSGECLRVLQGHTDRVTGCAFSPDGTRVVSASLDQSLRLWDAHSGECLSVLLCARLASARLDFTTGKIEHAEGSVWRHWAWQGQDEQGQPKVWPLDAMPDVEIKPWRWG